MTEACCVEMASLEDCRWGVRTKIEIFDADTGQVAEVVGGYETGSLFAQKYKTAREIATLMELASIKYGIDIVEIVANVCAESSDPGEAQQKLRTHMGQVLGI